jgi:hypothetical protein
MAVMVKLDFDASAEQYDKVDKAIDARGNPPDGLISHTAQDVGGKVRIVDVWESAEQFGAFMEDRAGPAIGEALGDDAPEVPDPEFTELHNAYKG